MAFPQIRASITSGAVETDAASFVCTHPTGLTAGDLMILFVGAMNPGADRGINTPSGWTIQEDLNTGGRRPFLALKKIATSGDVSAGSTTVTTSSTVDKFVYGMFAVTGAASGQEITLSEKDDVTVGGGTTTPTATTALTPIVPETLVFSAFFVSDFDLSNIITASSFSLTPTTTLTERVDTGLRDGSSDGCSLLIATGEYSGYTEITSRSVTVSESVGSTSTSFILLVNAPLNATASNATFEVSPALFTPTISNTNNVTNATFEVSPNFPDQDVNGTSPTQWTNETKASTTWINESL